MFLSGMLASISALVLVGTPVMAASSLSTDFESFNLGTINGQSGWSSTGSATGSCALYDHAVSSSLGATGFNTKSLRISNAVTSGCFGDQTFSASLSDEAGETAAENGGMSGGSRQPYFESSWDFASTVPGAEQPGLALTASPDRGDGARMSWVQLKDTGTGIDVNFYDYQSGAPDTGSGDGFVLTNVATGLSRATVHNVKITMQFVDGLNNDIVKVYVDGVLAHIGTSWEGYFVEQESNPTRTVDSVLFRTGGTAAPTTAGNGFLIDNLNLKSGAVPPPLVGPPTKITQCLKNGWKKFNNPKFKSQASCITYVVHKKYNHVKIKKIVKYIVKTSINQWLNPVY
jgi:hypothetical protein